MERLVPRPSFKRGIVVDVGSLDVNGTYRDLFGPEWKYVGVDIKPGKNVDLAMPSEYEIPFPDSSADLVISGQAIEHCRNPFKFVAEMRRVAKSGATIIIIAPFIWVPHRYPIDCWRFLPDGMKQLFVEAGLILQESKIEQGKKEMEQDCYAVGVKP